jgi:putative hydrolase of the HAD superfamily
VKELVVFDLDDTLYPEREFVLSGFGAVGDLLRRRHDLTGFADVAAGLYCAGVRGNIFDATLERLGFRHDDDLIRALVAAYRDHIPRISLYDDARWALDHFGARGKIGLLTDGFLSTQQRKTAALGIAPIFDAIVYSDAFGRASWKPSPVPYRTMSVRTGCAAAGSVYVSDNPAKDFVTAKALGWLTVRILRQGGEYSRVRVEGSHEAHHQISSLYDLEPLLAANAAG